MKVKQGFILRKLGREYMVVAIGEASKSFNAMIRMNEAGAWLWKQMQEDISRDELVEKMCVNYEGLDKETAAADLNEFLETVKTAIAE